MQNIHLSYGRIQALQGVDFHVRGGEIHALIGEHRSGKTSLVRILAGELRPDRGSIYLRNRAVFFNSPVDAARAGIGLVHQNLQIIPSLNPVENIFGDRLPKVWLRYRSYGRYVRQARDLLARLGMENLNLQVPTGALPEDQQQVVEFARILALDPTIVILDEIARRQSRSELDRILSLVGEFRDAGKSVIYITTDINEVFDLADRVTILADGHRRGTSLVKDLDRLRLVRLAYNLAIESNDDALPLAMQQFNETVIRDLPIGAFILDGNDRVFLANEEAGRLCGRPAAELEGHSLADLVRTQMGANADRVLASLSENDKATWDGLPFGTAEFTRVQTNRIGDDELRVVGRVLLVQDATLDQSVTEYLARAEKLQSTAELAAGVAHEINNPLGTIRNYVELLKIRNPDGDTRNKLDRISGEMDRIVEIVGSLLSFSRVRTERRQPMNIVELTREVVTLLGHRFREKHLRITERLPAEPIIIAAEENRIKQVLINIIVNSIEATLDGDLIDVRVARLSDCDSVEVTVRDTGSGIPDDVRDQIFRPFYTTKASKTNTGLGLSICRHIVESHGGTIEADSRPGEFTEVRVRLPAAAED